MRCMAMRAFYQHFGTHYTFTHSLTHSFSQSVSQSMCVFAGQFDTSLSQSSSVDVFWCDLDGLQTVCSVFWHVRHIIIIGNSTETQKKHLHFNCILLSFHGDLVEFFFPRILCAMNETNRLDERNDCTNCGTENVCYCNT